MANIRYGSRWHRVPRKWGGKDLCGVCGQPIRFGREGEHRECVRKSTEAPIPGARKPTEGRPAA